ncbi:MAG: hypothetical protein P8Z80_18190 [Pseudolabrys sp.]
MKRMMKYAAAAGVAGLLAIGLSAPTQAASRHDMAPAEGYRTAAANMHNDYGGAGYGRFAGPAYGAYAYVPGPAMQGSGQVCDLSPASPNYVPCPSH